jgi:hypothetical protein
MVIPFKPLRLTVSTRTVFCVHVRLLLFVRAERRSFPKNPSRTEDQGGDHGSDSPSSQTSRNKTKKNI